MAVIQSSVIGTAVIRILATWAVIHGLLVILGGIGRWNGPVYQFVRLLPGSPYTWGVILMLGGFLALYASIRGVDYVIKINKNTIVSYRIIKNAGLWIIAVWCALFSAGFIGAMYLHPELSLALADRDILICILSLLMTKAVEPRYKLDDSKSSK
jgi:hypothetical protein